MNETNGTNIFQSGNELNTTGNIPIKEILLNVLAYFALQLIPILALLVLFFICDNIVFNSKSIIENIFIICVVSNACSIYNNLVLKANSGGRILGKFLMFARIFLVCIGSIVYSIILADSLVERLGIEINYNHAWIPAMIMMISTFVIAFFSMIDGGEI